MKPSDAERMADWLPLVRIDQSGSPAIEMSGKPTAPATGSTKVMLRRPPPSTPAEPEAAVTEHSTAVDR